MIQLHSQRVFVMHEGNLFESTGATQELPQTRSLFGIVELTSGEIDPKVELDKQKYFGEGITFLNGQVFQLTYKTKIGFIYDAVTFKKVKEFTFPSEEGWGLTTDGTNLIMSDGTYNLTYLDPVSLQMIKKISVVEDGYAKNNLNELALSYDAKNLYPSSLEMNGIAYDSVANRIFVTGKLWPKIYELEIDEK